MHFKQTDDLYKWAPLHLHGNMKHCVAFEEVFFFVHSSLILTTYKLLCFKTRVCKSLGSLCIYIIGIDHSYVKERYLYPSTRFIFIFRTFRLIYSLKLHLLYTPHTVEPHWNSTKRNIHTVLYIAYIFLCHTPTEYTYVFIRF